MNACWAGLTARRAFHTIWVKTSNRGFQASRTRRPAATSALTAMLGTSDTTAPDTTPESKAAYHAVARRYGSRARTS
jgi:hypothetical protein